MAETAGEIPRMVDDWNPESGGWVLEQLTQTKAQDVYLVPIDKKENRPALLLSVLWPEDRPEAIQAASFARRPLWAFAGRRCLRRNPAMRWRPQSVSETSPESAPEKGPI